MGLLTRPVKELRARKGGAEGPLAEVRAIVYAPEENEGHKDFSCRVHCAYLFPDDKRIAGVDAEQALELAVMFVKLLLEPKGFVVVEEKDLA